MASPGAAVASTWSAAASRRVLLAGSSYGGYIAAALASLHTDAGFVDVTVQAVPGMVKFDSIQAFIRCQCAGSPLAAHVNLRDKTLLTRIAEVVAAALDAPVTGQPAEFAIEAHLVHAQGNAD